MQQPCSDYNDSCSTVVYQAVDVGLPITLTPSVNVGNIKLQCGGEPRVELHLSPCGSRMELRIIQTVTYKIPVEYSIVSNTGSVTSEFEKRNTINENQHRY